MNETEIIICGLLVALVILLFKKYLLDGEPCEPISHYDDDDDWGERG